MPVKTSWPLFGLLCTLALAAVPQSLLASTQKMSLQKYDVSELKVWHIERSTYSGKLIAYVMDPEGFVHHLEVAETLGKSGGVVYKITRCEVLFKELISDGKGGWNEVHRSLSAPDCISPPSASKNSH